MTVERICSIEGCERTRNARGMCSLHYGRWKRFGDALTELVGPYTRDRQRRDDVCTIEGCNGEHSARGYCGKHYARLQKYGDPNVVKRTITHSKEGPCIVDGCENSRKARGLCAKHYKRLRSHGDVNAKPKIVRTYIGAHAVVRRVRGRAAEYDCQCAGACGVCPCVALPNKATDWAYDHADPEPVLDRQGLLFSLDPDRYIPMCRSCHRRFDRQIDREIVQRARRDAAKHPTQQGETA